MKLNQKTEMCWEVLAIAGDNFCGNIDNKYVRISVGDSRQEPNTKPWARVGVWGNDDFGMIRDFQGEGCLEKAMKLAESLVEPVKITDLEKLGFERF